MRRYLDWVPVLFGLGLMAVLISLQWPRVVRGQNDFAALYAGATLVGSADLYSRQANLRVIERALDGVTMETVVFTRPPFYAWCLKPLASLPYLAGYAVFVGLLIFSVIWFVWRFQAEAPALPVFAAFSIPLAAVLPQGQDTPFLLLFLGGAIWQARQGRDFVSGLLLACCAIKFHLFVLVPVAVLLHRRWGILRGAACGGAVFLGVSLPALGDYVRVLRDPWIHFKPEMMPNLHGLANGGIWELPLVALVAGLVLWGAWRAPSFDFALGLCLIGGLLVSFHSGIGDQVLLLPAFVLLLPDGTGKFLRGLLAVALTPLPYFSGLGINVSVPITLLAVLATAVSGLTARRIVLSSDSPCLRH